MEYNISRKNMKRRYEKIIIQFKKEGINLTALWNGIITSFNMLMVAGIVLFMFPDGRWSDDYTRGFATGGFLIFMIVSPNLIYCAKYILRKIRKKRCLKDEVRE
jgi:hypothetical protein